jgi:hypothetical protein
MKNFIPRQVFLHQKSLPETSTSTRLLVGDNDRMGHSAGLESERDLKSTQGELVQGDKHCSNEKDKSKIVSRSNILSNSPSRSEERKRNSRSSSRSRGEFPNQSERANSFSRSRSRGRLRGYRSESFRVESIANSSRSHVLSNSPPRRNRRSSRSSSRSRGGSRNQSRYSSERANSFSRSRSRGRSREYRSVDNHRRHDFFHGRDAYRNRRSSNHCHSWKNRGQCNKGDECIYLHAVDYARPEIRRREMSRHFSHSRSRSRENIEKRPPRGRSPRSPEERPLDGKLEAERLRRDRDHASSPRVKTQGANQSLIEDLAVSNLVARTALEALSLPSRLPDSVGTQILPPHENSDVSMSISSDPSSGSGSDSDDWSDSAPTQTRASVGSLATSSSKFLSSTSSLNPANNRDDDPSGLEMSLLRAWIAQRNIVRTEREEAVEQALKAMPLPMEASRAAIRARQRACAWCCVWDPALAPACTTTANTTTTNNNNNDNNSNDNNNNNTSDNQRTTAISPVFRIAGYYVGYDGNSNTNNNSNTNTNHNNDDDNNNSICSSNLNGVGDGPGSLLRPEREGASISLRDGVIVRLLIYLILI